MELSTLLLSRLQFAFTVGFHILFPALNLGLAIFLLTFEVQWLRTKNEVYKNLYQFWVKIFAVAFGLGVVTGLPLSFQFGTNFGAFSIATKNVIGPMLAYEVLTAFFLEATFLGIMLFGWGRVPKWIHLTSTVMVTIGATLSAFWIIGVNSWMHTPSGYEIKDGIFYLTSFWRALFNPSFIYHLTHMLMAAYLTTAFVVLGVMGYWLLKDKTNIAAQKGLKIALFWACFFAPMQLVLGDLHGIQTFHHQPIKVAAMEGLWDTTKGAPMTLFAIPDMENEKNHYEIAIPNLASLYLTHSWNGEVKGLKSVPKKDRPYVPLVFFSFRIMVGIGLLFIFLSFWGLWLWRKSRIFTHRFYLRSLIFAAPLGFVATIAGWIVTEVGRQPWVIQGLMRIEDAGSKHITASKVGSTLSAFIIIYMLLLALFIYFIFRLIKNTPQKPHSISGDENAY